jgi:hypothetical protein
MRIPDYTSATISTTEPLLSHSPAAHDSEKNFIDAVRTKASLDEAVLMALSPGPCKKEMRLMPRTKISCFAPRL